MERLTLTSFGRRPLSAGQIMRNSRGDSHRDVTNLPGVNKWDLLRNATTARASLGVGNRTLGVLSALISFHRGDTLPLGKPVIVFPSNRTLSDRAHGMPESTLRRHLALLVEANLIARHDSPNGKRYARRTADGEATVAFGFDLSPLVYRAAELNRLAEETLRMEKRLKEIRERCVLMVRDIFGFIAALNPSAEIRVRAEELPKSLRRKLDERALVELAEDCNRLLVKLKELSHTSLDTAQMSANHSENERHIQDSKQKKSDDVSQVRPGQDLDIGAFLEACPEITTYCSSPISSWDNLVGVAASVRRFLGIDDRTWASCLRMATPIHAACVVAFILECKERVTAPGAYLRSMMGKAARGEFDLGLLVRSARRAGERLKVDSCQLTRRATPAPC